MMRDLAWHGRRELAIAGFAVALLVGCGPSSSSPMAPTSGPAANPRPAQQAAAPACGSEIPGWKELSAPLVLLGEIHGTTETPAAFGVLVCHAAALRRGKTVLVGLEMFSNGQAAVDVFLDSAGGSGARSALLAQEFWQRDYQDGRSSKARLDMLEELRRYRASGLKIVVRAIDPRDYDSPTDRDAKMAAALVEAIESLKPAQTLVLVGDVHARTLGGYPWEPGAAYVPLGARLREKYPDLIALDTAYRGSAWTCISSVAKECGVREVHRGILTGQVPRIALDPEALPKTGYAGTLFLGDVTPSPPARLPLGDAAG